MEKSGLSKKQELFCKEYVIDWNATRAAKAAGYSEKTAHVMGWENIRKPKIKAYIDRIKNNYEELAGLSKLKVLQEHAKIAFSSLADLQDNWIERKDFEDLPEEVKSCIAETQTRTRTIQKDDETFAVIEEVRIKMFDKQKSLESIAKMMGYNEPEKVDLSNKGESFGTQLTPEQVDDIIAKL